MKPKHFLLIISSALMAALMAFILLHLIIVIIAFVVPQDVVRPRAFPFGKELNDRYINATAISADFTDKVSVNESEISAPQNNMYMIVDIEITAIDGNWDVMSDFTVYGNGLFEGVSFDREITSQLNGCDPLKLNSSEKQSVSLVFLLPESERRTGYKMTVQYADGGCSESFWLCSLQEDTVQA